MKYSIIVLSLIITSCGFFAIDNPVKGTYNGYVIEKGKNNAKYRVPGSVLFSNEIKFNFRILGNVAYQPIDSAIHKLYGMSDYGSSHTNNSLRIGWRMRQDTTVDIFAYWHNDGKFKYSYLGQIQLEEEGYAELKITNDYYHFTLNGKYFKTARTKSWEIGHKYRLFPYFEDGQGHGPPHDMTFYIFEY